jgi:HK97 family phage prohead protease
MLVRKTINVCDADLKIDGESGKFAGYASVFGGVDSYGDTIAKGAFEATLKANGKPKMFYNHDWDMPIGKYQVAREDDKGLYVEGEFTPGMQRSAEVRAAMKHGTIDGLSIGGFLKRGDYEETENGRLIKQWSTLVEVSPVVFPADSAARVESGSVKVMDLEAALADVETVREFERLLRDAGGFSKAMAAKLVARAKVIFSEREPGETAEARAKRACIERIAALAGVQMFA